MRVNGRKSSAEVWEAHVCFEPFSCRDPERRVISEPLLLYWFQLSIVARRPDGALFSSCQQLHTRPERSSRVRPSTHSERRQKRLEEQRYVSKRKELFGAGINSPPHDAAVSATMSCTRVRYQDLIDLRSVRSWVTITFVEGNCSSRGPIRILE